ncbi:unnamed protein product [Urochloa humidicola]
MGRRAAQHGVRCGRVGSETSTPTCYHLIPTTASLRRIGSDLPDHLPRAAAAGERPPPSVPASPRRRSAALSGRRSAFGAVALSP